MDQKDKLVVTKIVELFIEDMDGKDLTFEAKLETMQILNMVQSQPRDVIIRRSREVSDVIKMLMCQKRARVIFGK